MDKNTLNTSSKSPFAEKTQLIKKLSNQLNDNLKRGIYSTARSNRKVDTLPTLQSNMYKISNDKPMMSNSERILKKINGKLNKHNSKM